LLLLIFNMRSTRSKRTSARGHTAGRQDITRGNSNEINVNQRGNRNGTMTELSRRKVTAEHDVELMDREF
jgi:hypothetical protein